MNKLKCLKQKWNWTSTLPQVIIYMMNRTFKNHRILGPVHGHQDGPFVQVFPKVYTRKHFHVIELFYTKTDRFVLIYGGSDGV